MIPDAQLVQKVRQGDPEAFSELRTRYHASLLAIAARRSPAHAEDVVQATWARVWERRASLDPKLSIRGYLATVTSRLAIGTWRKEQTLRRALDRITRQPTPTGSQTYPEPAQPSRLREFAQAFEECFDHLTERTRACLVGKVFTGHSINRVAEDLGMTAAAAWSTLTRARTLLRECLRRKEII